MDTLALFGALIGSNALSVFITQWFNRRKSKTEATLAAMDGVVKWAESMRDDIIRLNKSVEDIQVKYESVLKENSSLQIRVAHLEIELKIAQSAAG